MLPNPLPSAFSSMDQQDNEGEDCKLNWSPARRLIARSNVRRLPPSLLTADSATAGGGTMDDVFVGGGGGGGDPATARAQHRQQHPQRDGHQGQRQVQQRQYQASRGYESYGGIMDELDRVLQTYHQQGSLHQLGRSSNLAINPTPIPPSGIPSSRAVPHWYQVSLDPLYQDLDHHFSSNPRSMSHFIQFLKNLDSGGGDGTAATTRPRHNVASGVLPNESNSGMPYHIKPHQRLVAPAAAGDSSSTHYPSPIRSSSGSSGSEHEIRKIPLASPGIVRGEDAFPFGSVDQHDAYDSDDDSKLPAKTITEGTSTTGRSKRPTTTKKPSTSKPTTSSSSSSLMYKSEKWDEKYQQLISFKESHGHCLVPHNWMHNPSLAQWVKRQRYQYVLKHKTWGRCIDSKRVSTLTDKRQQLLEDIGFVWSPHDAMWEEKYHELMEYKAQTGNCNVPTNYPENRSLSSWVRGQRHQYKLLMKNQKEQQSGSGASTDADSKAKNHNAMMMERMSRLKALGFNFNPRNLKRK